MKIFQSIQEFKSDKKTIITIGTFDGVHKGHQKVLSKLINEARECELESLLLTFDVHPRIILEKESEVQLLTTNCEKIKLLEEEGIDNLVIQKFDKQFAELPGRDFVQQVLVEKLNTKKVIIGYDHRFGKNRQCGIEDLILYGEEFGFEVEQISAKEIDEIKISSTRIRNAILEGRIGIANDYLGYHYFFSGVVVKGKQLGRTIGFPTANIQIDSIQKIVPKYGVYVVTGENGGEVYKGMMNIGVRPTVDGQNLSVEVHFFDFDQDVYGKEFKINILEFVREEKKFDSIEELKAQISRDKEFSLNYFETLS
ncbi:MAG: bifunctional riboflavin kinase/FAD synthetase [Limnohabitans sp.]|nr:bifunctional riboflavin kinase/FAD synthetase [Limnohabitans sp.]